MNHYFQNTPDLAHDEHHFDFDLVGHSFHFTSDSGVFSKHTVDYGSRVLIDVVAQAPKPDGPLLDVGCGWGPIGLALAKVHPERTVMLTDVNERALALARRNAEANGIENVTIQAADGYAGVTETDFAAIVTNPPIRAGKAVVSAILAGAFSHLRPGGSLYAVLQKKQGAKSALRLLQTTFGAATVVKKDKGYYVLQAQKA